MSAACFKCNQSCIFKEPAKNANEIFGYPCDLCKRVMCKKCSEITSTEIRVLILSNRTIPYICRDCAPKIVNVFRLADRVTLLESEIAEVKSSLNMLSELANQLKSLKDDLKSDLHTALGDIRLEISAIKSTPINPSANDESQATLHQNQNLSNNVLTEMAERQKRSCNIMIFNLPEKGEHEDEAATDQLISNLVNCPLEIKKITRLGKKNKNGYRSLRVTLNSAEDVHKILRHKKNLDRSQKIFINSDLTIQQREILNQLKNEIKTRHRNGEQNLTIKHVNGEPRIISKN